MFLLCGGAYRFVWYTFEKHQEASRVISTETEPPQLEDIILSSPVGFQPMEGEAGSLPRYVSNAAIIEAVPHGNIKVAIILDDLGMHESIWPTLSELPLAITYAYLPYGKYTSEQASMARKIGHEIMIHLPMEPHTTSEGKTIDPGPDALYTAMQDIEIDQMAHINLDNLKEIAVGVNNHMGSKFTEWQQGLEEVLHIVKSEGMFFLDSVTTAHSAVPTAAESVNIPLLRRDIFLDHSQEIEDIHAMLTKLEERAKKNGHAIAIGHPHGTTLQALKEWIPTLEAKNITLVPITNLLQEKIDEAEPDGGFGYQY